MQEVTRDCPELGSFRARSGKLPFTVITTMRTAIAASAAPFRIEETSITALHAVYLNGQATAVSVCQAHLDRIAAYDRKGPALGAIIIINPHALADAASFDAVLASTGKLIGPCMAFRSW